MVVWLFCFPKQNFAKSDLQAAIPNRTSPRLEKQKRVAGPRRRARNQAGKAGKPLYAGVLCPRSLLHFPRKCILTIAKAQGIALNAMDQKMELLVPAFF
jgi:hypothetical protein